MPRRLAGLWRHPDFIKLWAGETISLLGTQITLLALPLTAVVLLDASPQEMGILTAAETAPFLLIGLLAGVWIDRRRRRPIMMAANVGRALLLGLIPLLDLLGMLHMAPLVAIAFAVGTLTVFFDVAYQVYLPALVSREHLVEGNAKLEISRSGAQIVGPGVGGWLVGLVTAPIAIAVDALSFLVSTAFLGAIRQPEPAVARQGPAPGLRPEIAEGLRLVLGNPMLRAIAGCTATANLFGSIMTAIFVLYATRDLGIGAGLLGLIFAAGNVGFLLGALLAGQVPRRIGLGRTITLASLLGGLGTLLVPLAGGSQPMVIAMLIAAQFIIGLSSPLYNVNQVSLRQTITPDRLQGRMNASMRFIVWGTMPLGSLLGGALGGALGLRPTLLVAALGGTLAFLWVWHSPVHTLQTQPPPAEPAVPLAGRG
ncbi:MAG: MFS transporter [Sphaerobacter sp.]|nr:MFS transporter [Sphaerobacter sp.]